MRFEKMPAHCGTVPLSDDDMRVHLGLAFIQRNVADERDNFHLFVHLVLQVVLLLQVKVPDAPHR